MKETELDWHICSRARLSRDPRFDGKFFIGVNGSGVYCRSVCPAPTAKEKNCRYFATAAAAAEAGYRPCLRCRPECAPGTPAWLGTSATVARALRLIEQQGLHQDGMEGLAERLGVGSRHLRRLFLKHLGAPPATVAQTRRAHFAKKLIDETSLPMTQIAFAAGYGSVRRFNAGIAKTFHRTPTQIRANARAAKSFAENEYAFVLRFRPPYDWKGILQFLGAAATPGVELITENSYRRTISFEGASGQFNVELEPSQPALRARICFGEPRALFHIVERIRRIFDLNADWAAIMETLGGDPLLASALKSRPGLRLPGCWDGFELAVRTLLSRNPQSARAKELAGRLVQAFAEPISAGRGLTHLFPSPETLANAGLSKIGLSRSRADAIRELARAVLERRISFEGVLDSEQFLGQLRTLTRLDEWAAQYVAMRGLAEPDAFPVDSRNLPARFADIAVFKQRAERWRPWRAYAALCLANFNRTALQPTQSVQTQSPIRAAAKPVRREPSLAI